MNKQAFSSPNVPAPIGPYSPAVVWGNLVFLSGQGPRDPKTGTLGSQDIAKQTRQALANVESLLQAAGTSHEQVLKVTVYLTDLNNFETMNAVYKEFFAGTTFPARTTVQVAALPGGIGIELDVIAARKGQASGGAP